MTATYITDEAAHLEATMNHVARGFGKFVERTFQELVDYGKHFNILLERYIFERGEAQGQRAFKKRLLKDCGSRHLAQIAMDAMALANWFVSQPEDIQTLVIQNKLDWKANSYRILATAFWVSKKLFCEMLGMKGAVTKLRKMTFDRIAGLHIVQVGSKVIVSDRTHKCYGQQGVALTIPDEIDRVVVQLDGTRMQHTLDISELEVVGSIFKRTPDRNLSDTELKVIKEHFNLSEQSWKKILVVAEETADDDKYPLSFKSIMLTIIAMKEDGDLQSDPPKHKTKRPPAIAKKHYEPTPGHLHPDVVADQVRQAKEEGIREGRNKMAIEKDESALGEQVAREEAATESVRVEMNAAEKVIAKLQRERANLAAELEEKNKRLATIEALEKEKEALQRRVAELEAIEPKTDWQATEDRMRALELRNENLSKANEALLARIKTLETPGNVVKDNNALSAIAGLLSQVHFPGWKKNGVFEFGSKIYRGEDAITAFSAAIKKDPNLVTEWLDSLAF